MATAEWIQKDELLVIKIPETSFLTRDPGQETA